MINKAYVGALAVAGAAFLSSCAVTLSQSNRVGLGENGQFLLLPPKDLPKIDGVHMVTVNQNGKKEMFIGQLQVDSRVIRLDGSSLLGPTLFEVSYDGHTLHSDPRGAFVHPGILIAMLEMVLARRPELQGALHGLTMQEKMKTSGIRVRDIYERGRLVMHIEISGKRITQARIRLVIPPANVSVLMQPLGSSIRS